MENKEINFNFEPMENSSSKSKRNLFLLVGLLLLNLIGYMFANYYFNKNQISENEKVVTPHNQHSSITPTISSNKTLDWGIWLLRTLRGDE